MIAQNERIQDRTTLWAALAAPLPAGAIEWRQDGKPTARDGKHFARFVPYVSAQYVRERLDAVVPGEWDLSLELLPPATDSHGEVSAAFKARLNILGVSREDVGMSGDYKGAATDAFKRAAMRFGIGSELYAAEANWVQVDGDGKFAKPVEDPTVAYVRRYGALPGGARPDAARAQNTPSEPPRARSQAAQNLADFAPESPLASNGGAAPAATDDEPSCPKCSGRMWDNRLTKRNPKAPDFKCRDRQCDGVIWPEKPGRKAEAPATVPADDEMPSALEDEDDDLPF